MAADGSGPKGWRLLPRRRRRPAEDLDPGRSDLVVVAAGFDDAEASSAALDRAASGDPPWMPAAQVLLRHHLLLPAGEVDEAVAVAAQDGYRPAGDPIPVAGALTNALDGAPEVPDAQVVVLQRVQILDALHCSQERSRMAGLAQRRNGVALGWEALQPPPGRRSAAASIHEVPGGP